VLSPQDNLIFRIFGRLDVTFDFSEERNAAIGAAATGTEVRCAASCGLLAKGWGDRTADEVVNRERTHLIVKIFSL